MANQKITSRLFFVFIITALLISCATSIIYDPEDPYPGIEILRYPSSGLVYTFPNEGSDKLIIILEEAGWNSVLGYKEDTWEEVGLAIQLIQELCATYSFLVPEKLKRLPGTYNYGNMEDQANYTAENLIGCYSESINRYLSGHEFSSIVLIGRGEGAILLPFVYERMSDKDKVTAMVSMGHGGLSWYESYQILSATRSFYDKETVEMFNDIFAAFNPENTEFPDSFEENYFGMTYRYFSSIMHIRPFDYYKNIDIPILFVHGDYDYHIPYESTEYIQKNLPEKPFDYLYYPWGRQPEKRSHMFVFRREIAEWIIMKAQ